MPLSFQLFMNKYIYVVANWALFLFFVYIFWNISNFVVCVPRFLRHFFWWYQLSTELPSHLSGKIWLYIGTWCLVLSLKSEKLLNFCSYQRFMAEFRYLQSAVYVINVWNLKLNLYVDKHFLDKVTFNRKWCLLFPFSFITFIALKKWSRRQKNCSNFYCGDFLCSAKQKRKLAF